MPPGKLYSSCDACRHSRLGCNSRSQNGDSCFNCARKGLNCTFSQSRIRLSDPNKGPASHKQRATARKNNTTQARPAHSTADQPVPSVDCPPTVDNNLLVAPLLSTGQDSLNRTQQALQLHQILWNVFTTLLEPRIGLWLGGSGCPFVQSSTAPTTLISRLAITLDSDTGASPINHNDLFAQTIRQDVNSGINRALTFSIYAYAVRWLSLGGTTDDANSVQVRKSLKRDLSENLWKQARQNIYPAMSKPTYRSILALYLFAIVPSSSIDEGNGIKTLCFDAALNHHNHLLSNRPSTQIHADPIAKLLAPEVYPQTTNSQSNLPSGLQPDHNAEFKAKTDIMYWFGIILDTTRSLTRCRPSIMLPGRSGEAKVWGTIRQRTDIFEQEHRALHNHRSPLDDSKVIVILQHAFAFKVLVWAAIIRVQDAIYHQVSEITLEEALEAVRRDSNRFEEVFEPLLSLCQRDFIYLNRSTQMSYTLLKIQFQMASLILADSCPDTLVFTDADSEPYSLRLCACRNIVNAVSLAMRTDFTRHDEGPGSPSILLLDPYPDYMTTALIRTGSSLFQLHSRQQISPHTAISMFSTVIAALEILGEISHLALEAIPLLRAKFTESGIGQIASDPNRQQNDVFYQAALSVASPVDENLFNVGVVEELEQQANNPGLVDKSVIQTETNMILSSFLTDEFEHVDLDLFSQEWTLDECFSEPFQFR